MRQVSFTLLLLIISIVIRTSTRGTFNDFMGSGAWPFIVGGLLCQVDSGNERDLLLLIRF